MQWLDLGNGRRVLRQVRERPVDARSDLACPQIMSDRFDKPVQNMIDGKFYESKAALRATYKPSGNAEGKEYMELGHDPVPEHKHVRDKKKALDTIARAEADIASGNAPPARFMSEVGGE